MSTHTFFATLIATVELSDAEFDLLWKSSEKHYDSTVELSCKQGGFLYGAKNRRSFSNGEDKTADFKFRQLDLMLKALEFPFSEEKAVLSLRLQKIMQDMREKHAEINKQLGN